MKGEQTKLNIVIFGFQSSNLNGGNILERKKFIIFSVLLFNLYIAPWFSSSIVSLWVYLNYWRVS